MVQQIDEALGSDPREEAREEAFASGLPKMILLLVWANKERGLRGLPGVRRHWKKGRTLEFSFSAIPTDKALKAQDDDPENGGQDGTHFLEPTQYWPSFRTGLALFQNTRDTSWVVELTDAGKKLAEAFASSLKKLDRHLVTWLRSPTLLSSSTKKLEPLKQALALDGPPSALERARFLDQFYPVPDKIDRTNDTMEPRSRGLTLILRTLAAGHHDAPDEFMTVPGIRQAMGVGVTSSLTRIDVTQLEDTQQTWHALQITQYLRFVLESLFRVAEVVTHNLAIENAYHGADHNRSATGVAERIARQTIESISEWAESSVSTAIADFDPPPPYSSLYEAGVQNPKWNPHMHMAELTKAAQFKLSGDPLPCARLALGGLIWCVAEGAKIPDSVCRKVTTYPSLRRLHLLANEYGEHPVEEFFARVIRDYVLKLHAAVSRKRTESDIRDGHPIRDRFRISEGDSGLERNPRRENKLTTVELMADILPNALLLLTQAGLTESNKPGTGFRLTQQGHIRVRQAWR